VNSRAARNTRSTPVSTTRSGRRFCRSSRHEIASYFRSIIFRELVNPVLVSLNR
jgi:hypothetical protein